MTDIRDKFVAMANQAQRAIASRDKHGWDTGIFNPFRQLTNDTKGDIGELFIVWLLAESGRESERLVGTNPTEDPYDIRVITDNITLEVKTATLGRNSNTFQHEGLEQNRRCDGMVFLDIAPNEIYITCLCKHTFDWSTAHRRRHGVQIKKDLQLRALIDGNHKIRNIANFELHYSAMLAEIRAYKQARRGRRPRKNS